MGRVKQSMLLWMAAATVVYMVYSTLLLARSKESWLGRMARKGGRVERSGRMPNSVVEGTCDARLYGMEMLPADVVIHEPGKWAEHPVDLATSYEDAVGADVALRPYRMRVEACAPPRAPGWPLDVDAEFGLTPGSKAAFEAQQAEVKEAHPLAAGRPRVLVVVRVYMRHLPLRPWLMHLAKHVTAAAAYDMVIVYDSELEQLLTSAEMDEMMLMWPHAFRRNMADSSQLMFRAINATWVAHECYQYVGGYWPDAIHGGSISPELFAPLIFGCHGDRPSPPDMIPDANKYDLLWIQEGDAVFYGGDPVTEFYERCDAEARDWGTGAPLAHHIDLITPYPLHLMSTNYVFPEAYNLPHVANAFRDDSAPRFLNQIQILRTSRRLLHRLWLNAAECGHLMYCEMALPTVCGYWPDCVAGFFPPGFNSNIHPRYDACEPYKAERAIRQMEAAADSCYSHDTVADPAPIPRVIPEDLFDQCHNVRNHADVNTWVHKSTGPTDDYLRTMRKLYDSYRSCVPS